MDEEDNMKVEEEEQELEIIHSLTNEQIDQTMHLFVEFFQK